jgi:hypothetical protein
MAGLGLFGQNNAATAATTPIATAFKFCIRPISKTKNKEWTSGGKVAENIATWAFSFKFWKISYKQMFFFNLYFLAT